MGSETPSWSTWKNGSLKLDASIAVDCANACKELIQTFDTLSRYLKSAEKLKGHDLGGLDSSERLATRFNDKMQSLLDTVDQHIKLVTDMGDTFINAGKRYADTDSGSAEWFKQLSDFSLKPDSSKNTTLYPSSGTPANPGDVKVPDNLVPKNQVGMDKVDLGVENYQSMLWDQLIKMRDSINVNPLRTVAFVWKCIDDTAVPSATKIRDLMDRTKKEDTWRGVGADAARGAVTRYFGELQDLAKQSMMVSRNASYTADYLAALYYALAPMPTQEVEGDLAKYQGYFNSIYVTGIHNTEKLFPKLPQPSGIPGPNAQGSNDDNPGKNNKGNGSDTDKGGKSGGNGKDDTDDGGKNDAKGGGDDKKHGGGGGGSEGGGSDAEKKGKGTGHDGKNGAGGPGPGSGIHPPEKSKPGAPKTDPAKSDPAKSDPAITDPAKGDPNAPGPIGTQPRIAASDPSSGMNMLTPLISAVTQGIQAVGQTVQGVIQAESARIAAGLPGDHQLDGKPDTDEIRKAGGPGGPGKAGAPNIPPPPRPVGPEASKLFPRAALPSIDGKLLTPPGNWGPGLPGGIPGVPVTGSAANHSTTHQDDTKLKIPGEEFLEDFGIEPSAVRPVLDA
ncbi:hypothetical protein [Nocardia arthritidis]|uniref:Uncharacterized protein n=1 Tax=Nocardia arthritidis TaxID=228602 RepID=A0A6G9Y7B8_9NOCA|nr:hypothetical protein [Nocardia arthritidis]QIS08966.1 hypothetical protein F5544_05270 [Nocardia arthritidis]